VNNILLPEDIVDEPLHTLSSAAPGSSTAALAGLVPKEKQIEKTQSNESIPGAFPMTPPAETPGTEQQMFNINPIAATPGLGNPIKLAPEEQVPASSTLTDNTVQSTVNLDKLPEDEDEAEATVSVAPIPATAGAGNPIHLAPGEKVPHPSTLTSNTVESTANTDPDSYEKASAFPPQLGPVDFTPAAERQANGGMFALPPQLDNLIPESSLPMGVDALVEKDTGVHIQSAAPLSSTAALAAQVPKEPRGVPEIVSDSQKEAGVAPEAAANEDAVLDKKEVEQELKETVPEQTPTADGSTTEAPAATTTATDIAADIGAGLGAVGGAVAAGATIGAGLFAAAAYSAKENAAEAVGLPKDATVAETAFAAKDKAIDAVGLDSSATAADNATIAKESTLDAVGLDKTATVTDNAILAKDKAAAAVGLNGSASPEVADDVPAIVAESQKEAHSSPEAASNVEAVAEKSQVEQELLSEIPKTREVGESAPAIGVPSLVSESQREAHVSPEASSNILAVGDKKDVESELLSAIPKTNESGEPAPVITASTSTTAPGLKTEEVASGVPEVVAESQKEAHVDPEAAANSEAVIEKKEVESELLNAVPKTNESGEPAPVASASQITTAPGSKTEEVAREVPDVVAESQKEAHVSPEAAANSEAAPGVSEYKPIEFTPIEDLKTHTHPEGLNASASTPAQTDATKAAAAESVEKPTTESDGLNAPASAPAQTEATKAVEPAEVDTVGQSEPTTVEQTEPTVASGIEAGKAPEISKADDLAVPEAEQKDRKDSDVSPKGTPGSQSVASASEDKKKKRRSFFGKLKDKLSGKH
jgi:hypothetical protein